jgi:DNA polymerase III epsilon subunit-like protein
MNESTNAEPLFLDFEASSFDGHPIEVAISTPDGEIRSWLIRPAPGWTDWSPKAEALHGISREMLAREGVPVREVARHINIALADRVAYSDSPEFDGWWCRQLFEAAGEEMQFSIGHAGSVIPDVPRRNGRIEREARRRAGPAHRAARDVAFLVELFRLATEAAARKQKGRKA